MGAGWLFFFVSVDDELQLCLSVTNFAAARLSLRGTWHSSLAIDPCRWRRPGLALGGLGLMGEVLPRPFP